MARQMSDAMKRLGRRNAVIALVVVAVVMLGAVGYLTQAVGMTFFHALDWFVVAFVGGLLIVAVPWSFVARRGAGPVLLDCGVYRRQPRSWGVLWIAALVVFGIWGAGPLVADLQQDASARGNGWLVSDLANLAAFVCLAMVMAPTYFGHLELRGNGIWISCDLARWDRIKSYRWEGEDGLTLMIDYDSRFPLFRQRAILVPAEHKEKLDELLRSYSPATE